MWLHDACAELEPCHGNGDLADLHVVARCRECNAKERRICISTLFHSKHGTSLLLHRSVFPRFSESVDIHWRSSSAVCALTMQRPANVLGQRGPGPANVLGQRSRPPLPSVFTSTSPGDTDTGRATDGDLRLVRLGPRGRALGRNPTKIASMADTICNDGEPHDEQYRILSQTCDNGEGEIHANPFSLNATS